MALKSMCWEDRALAPCSGWFWVKDNGGDSWIEFFEKSELVGNRDDGKIWIAGPIPSPDDEVKHG